METPSLPFAAIVLPEIVLFAAKPPAYSYSCPPRLIPLYVLPSGVLSRLIPITFFLMML